MNRFQLPRFLIVALFGIPSIAFCQSAEGVPSVDENGQLRFEQQQISAHMRELEERMMRLAALIRSQNPDDSARLLMGVETARDKLILEQMKTITGMLSEFQLGDASAEQQIVLEKLSQLRRALLNSEVGVEVNFQQLRSLADARIRLANLILNETEQREITANAKNQKSEIASELAARENRNLRLGQRLKQNLRQLAAPEEATIAMQHANDLMSEAEHAIKSSRWQAAEKAQLLAIEQMQKADQYLVETKRQLQANAESAARQRVIELLSRTIDLQTGVKHATAARFNQQLDRTLKPWSSLATEQQSIIDVIDECIEISVLAEFSFVLPDALRDVQQQMDVVKRLFTQGSESMRLVPLQDRILNDLEALLGAIQQASKTGSPKVQNNKINCCSDKNEILAEVKMLHWMQSQVNRKTNQLRDDTISPTPGSADASDVAKAILKQQNIIIDVTEKVRKISQNGFTKGDTAE